MSQNAMQPCKNPVDAFVDNIADGSELLADFVDETVDSLVSVRKMLRMGF